MTLRTQATALAERDGRIRDLKAQLRVAEERAASLSAQLEARDG